MCTEFPSFFLLVNISRFHSRRNQQSLQIWLNRKCQQTAGEEIMKVHFTIAFGTKLSYERNNTLYIFSAGNSASSGEFFVTDGYKSLRSPGSAKNILTIGAAQSVRVDEQVIGEDNKEIYMTDETDESTHLTKILKWSLQDYDKNIGMKTLFEQGRLKVQISRNPTEFTNTTVFGHR